MTQQWELFVDESGDLGSRSTTVCVTGVLVLPSHAPTEQTVRQQWRAIAPHLPWPMHTAHLLRPSWLPLSTIAACALDPEAATTDTRLVRIRALWEQHAPAALAHALSGLAEHRQPRLSVVLDLDESLALHAPALLDELQRDAWRLVRSVRTHLDAVQRDVPSLRILMAGEAVQPPAHEASTLTRQELDSARFARMLEALVQRTVDYLARIPGAHVLEVTVSRRGVATAWNHGYRQLTAQDVARYMAPVARYGDRIRLTARPPQPFWTNASVWEVMADFVACRACGTLASPHHALTDVVSKAEALAGARLMARTSRFPQLASDGLPLDHVRDAICGRPSVWPPVVSCRRWAREQAEGVVADVKRRQAAMPGAGASALSLTPVRLQDPSNE